MSLRFLITAGPTHEPIDPVRYIGNRSSGKMGGALVAAARDASHAVTLIAGPTGTLFPSVRRLDVQTAAQMEAAVLSEFPAHDVLIMAAAVADFRPVQINEKKLLRTGTLTIRCEPTSDIIAAAGRIKKSSQRTIAFSLESDGDLTRAREKMVRKNVDLMVFNSFSTMQSDVIRATLLFPAGPDEPLSEMEKVSFARLLIQRAEKMVQNCV